MAVNSMMLQLLSIAIADVRLGTLVYEKKQFQFPYSYLRDSQQTRI